MNCHYLIESYAAFLTLLCLALTVLCIVQALRARRVRRSRLPASHPSTNCNEDTDMDARIKSFAQDVGWLLLYGALATALVLGAAHIADAQDDPPMTFSASVTKAAGQLDTTLTWDAVGAAECFGEGHPAWEGQKASSGTQALPTITLSGTYQLRLRCVWRGDSTAKLSWHPPTQNVDGTELTNLAGYRIYASQDRDTIGAAEPVTIEDAGLTAYTFTDLSPGGWYFAVAAFNAHAVASELSQIRSKVITSDVAREDVIALTLNPRPMPPELVEVE